MGIKVWVNPGTGPFWGPERGNSRGNVGYLKIIPLTSHRLDALIFGMKHPWDKETQVCANKFPGVVCPAPRGLRFV